MKKRLTPISLLAAATLVAVVGGYLYYSLSKTPVATAPTRGVNDVDYSPSKPTDKIGESSKDQIAKTDPATGDDTQKPLESGSPLTVTITNTSQDSTTVYVRAITTNAGSGECELTLTNGSTSITKKATLSPQASYGICQGFNIAKSELGKGGQWQIRVKIVSGTSQGSADSSLEVTL